ncbi:MAG: tRNA 2-selenouridine(34) synthase MnmH [Cyclobacteriaceae bacterium]
MISLPEFFELRKSLPIVDVRSPIEFWQGHILNAINIPLLNNEERAMVGTDYKKKGQAEAIKTGIRLVGPRLEQIISDTEKIAAGKELLVHCWRGGMRSDNFSKFIGMAGIKSQVLKGGYKAYRQFALETFKKPLSLILLGGCTGSGKSEVIRALKGQDEQILDLEKMANHKGSAFGGMMMPPQPTTEQFQNELFEDILKLDLTKRIWVEDESIAIGKIFLPPDFWTTMSSSKIVKLDVTKDVRISRLVNEYGPADKNEFLEMMGKIVKRLGGQHFKEAKEKLLQGDMASTIDILLTYYDKTYLGSLDRRKHRVAASFSWDGKSSDSIARQLSNFKND